MRSHEYTNLNLQFIQFMFDFVPENDVRSLALCAAHFKKNSFQNLHQFNAGFNKKLFLKHEAVSTLKPEAAVVVPQPVSRLRQIILNVFACIISDVMFSFINCQHWLYRETK